MCSGNISRQSNDLRDRPAFIASNYIYRIVFIIIFPDGNVSVMSDR